MTAPESLDPRSHDVAGDRTAELLQLFPEIRTEGGKLDFDKLKLALGESVDVGKERYGLTWPGKAECFKTIQTPSLGTLLPKRDESVNFDTTENLIIEGDNLEVLKLLQKSYLGQVKMIYIDPPYNTGNDFIYPDNYSESLKTYLEYTGQVDAEGRRFSTNTEADGRFHSKWLNMMYPRLYLARNLLRDDGVIFVSIDDRELQSLRGLLTEVFGEECCVATLPVLCNPKGRALDKYFATNHEYVVCCSKTVLPKGCFSIEKDEDQVMAEYPEEDEAGKFRLLELRNTHREFGKHNRRNLYYSFFVSTDGSVRLENSEGAVRVYPDWDDGFEGCWTWDKEKSARDIDLLVGREVNGRWKVYRKSYASGAERMLKTMLTEKSYITERGQREFNSLFGVRDKLFQSPKSPLLIGDLIRTCTTDGDLVLDFFAGSGTTAHGVYIANSADGRKRHFILVQLPETCSAESAAARNGYRTIADLCKERVRRLLQSDSDNRVESHNSKLTQHGFRVFALAESNFTTWDAAVPHDTAAVERQMEMHVDHVRAGRADEDIVYELLLKSGFPLTTPVETNTLAGKTVYSVADGAMLVCVDRDLTLEVIRAIAAEEPQRVILLDEGFHGNDQLKANAVQTFKTKGVVKFQTV